MIASTFVREPKMKKSYHSIKVPVAAPKMTLARKAGLALSGRIGLCDAMRG